MVQPRWVPWVVSLLTCALLAGSVYAAERVGIPAPDRGAAATYVPEDGTAAYARVERPGQPPVTHVVESTRGTGCCCWWSSCFSALTREPSTASDLDAYARLGNLVLGTALLAAAYIAVLQLVTRDQALTPNPPNPDLSETQRVIAH